MTSDLSARLAWNDRGGDGRVTVASYRKSWRGRIDALEAERVAPRRILGA